MCFAGGRHPLWSTSTLCALSALRLSADRGPTLTVTRDLDLASPIRTQHGTACVSSLTT